GYTIKGVQRLLREGGGKLSDDIPPPAPEDQAEDGLEAETAVPEKEPSLPGLPVAEPAPAPGRAGVRRERVEREAERLRAVLAETLDELIAIRNALG
ncbi:MAG: MerR family transcriptional regulator, partial [Acetobacteraceae bacterium]|nr:MerR family transcriptional regulator [Acetobacteraceae bacterium]